MFAIVAYIYKSNTFILNSLLINWANFNFLLSIVSKICSHFLKDNRESLELQLIIINYKTLVKQIIPYWIHLLIWVLLLYLRNCKTLIAVFRQPAISRGRLFLLGVPFSPRLPHLLHFPHFPHFPFFFSGWLWLALLSLC